MHIVDPALAETLLATYGYAAIFALVMLESAGIPARRDDPRQRFDLRQH